MSKSLPDLLMSFPTERVAIDDGVQRETYGDLLSAARRISGWCAGQYGIGQCVVIKARSTAAFFKAWLGVVHSGNVVVPVDPEMPNVALRHVLRKTRSARVLEPEEITAEAAQAASNRETISNPDDVAMVMFTSGTTGSPKGVVMTNENLRHSWNAVSEYLGFANHASTICTLPLYYSYGLISQALCMLSVGGYVRLVDGMKNPLAFEKIVREEGIASFCGVPSSFSLLARFHKIKALSMPSIKVVCSAGAAFDMSAYPLMKEVFPCAEIFNNYGMTEACPRISYVSDRDPMFLKGSCGAPMRGVELVTLDPESHEVLPDGIEGVLGIRGPNITRGYLDEPERNRRAFQRDGYLVSGDFAGIVDGHLFIRGRSDDIFNVGGEKVAPIEIESPLNQMAGVAGSLVKGIHDSDRGQVPVAFLVLARSIEKRELDVFLSEHLVPAKIPVRYYEVSELPMTSNGKLKRSELSEASPLVLRLIT